jgi:hypothetical protein
MRVEGISMRFSGLKELDNNKTFTDKAKDFGKYFNHIFGRPAPAKNLTERKVEEKKVYEFLVYDEFRDMLKELEEYDDPKVQELTSREGEKSLYVAIDELEKDKITESYREIRGEMVTRYYLNLSELMEEFRKNETVNNLDRITSFMEGLRSFCYSSIDW